MYRYLPACGHDKQTEHLHASGQPRDEIMEVPILVQPPAHHPAVEDDRSPAQVKVDATGATAMTRPSFDPGQGVPYARHDAHVEGIHQAVRRTLASRRS
jgi:hypothetical protein